MSRTGHFQKFFGFAIVLCLMALALSLSSGRLKAQGIAGQSGPPGAPSQPFAPPLGPQPRSPFPAVNPPGAPPANAVQAQPASGQQEGGAAGGAVSGALRGAIAGGVLGLLLWLTLVAFRRTAVAAVTVDPATGGAVVQFSRGLRLLVAGFSAFTPLALLVAMLFIPSQGPAGYVVLVIAALIFAALGGAVCWSLAKSRFIATSEGLISESGWRRPRKLAWADVQSVVHDKQSGGLLLRTEQKIERVHLAAYGRPEAIGRRDAPLPTGSQV